MVIDICTSKRSTQRIIGILLFAFIFLALPSAATNAQEARRAPITFDHDDGNWLQSTCAEYVKDSGGDNLKAGECAGYLKGFIEGWDLNGFASDGIRLCFPAGVTTGQLAKIVNKYLNDHPEELHLDAANLLIHILSDKDFSCPASKK